MPQSLMTIFAHQDDETFSAGGLLARYADIGNSIAITITSDPQRKQEFGDACSILGCDYKILNNKSVKPDNEVKIKNQVIEVIREFRPDHIVTHIDFDYHYEHKLVRNIVEEAVEWVSHTTSNKNAIQVKSLWAAETTVLIPFPEIYVNITDYNSRRLEAISCYESQSHKGGDGFYSKFHNTRTKLRGIQADVEHAEAYLNIPIALAGSFKPTKVLDQLPY